MSTTCCERAEDLGLHSCPRCGRRIFPDDALVLSDPVLSEHEERVWESLMTATADATRVIGLDGADVAIDCDGQHLIVTRDPHGEDPQVIRYTPLLPGEVPHHWEAVFYFGHVWNPAPGQPRRFTAAQTLGQDGGNHAWGIQVVTEGDSAFADHFGRCPVCSRGGSRLNVNRVHFMVCHEHRLYWCAGSNLFGDWRYETPEDWARNETLLETYTPVEPCRTCHRMVDIATLVGLNPLVDGQGQCPACRATEGTA
jgi:hypothetical protein